MFTAIHQQAMYKFVEGKMWLWIQIISSLNDIRSYRREFYYYFCDDLVEIKICVILGVHCLRFTARYVFVDELFQRKRGGQKSFSFTLRICLVV